MIRAEADFRVARAVDVRLAVGGRHADGQLLERAAEAAHRVPLEVAQHEQGVIARQVLADVVLLDDLAIGDEQLQIRPFFVHDVHGEGIRPAMVAHGLPVGGGGVAAARIRRVALDDRAVHMLDHRPPKFGGQEVLVALFAGMQLHGDVPRQFQTTGFVELQHVFGSDIARKINLRCHKTFLLLPIHVDVTPRRRAC